jgi:quercetin dioxygenase-like cupin family protein
MAQLTDTSAFSSLTYTLPSQQHTITVHLPGSPMVSSIVSDASNHRIMEIPVKSKWSPGTHWHEDYVEHIKILKGKARVYINGKCRELVAGNEATFELFDVHDFCRSDFDEGESLLIEEWTDNGKPIQDS